MKSSLITHTKPFRENMLDTFLRNIAKHRAAPCVIKSSDFEKYERDLTFHHLHFEAKGFFGIYAISEHSQLENGLSQKRKKTLTWCLSLSQAVAELFKWEEKAPQQGWALSIPSSEFTNGVNTIADKFRIPKPRRPSDEAMMAMTVIRPGTDEPMH